MNGKLPSQNDWKATALKFKVKDNGLQRALAAYEGVDEEKYEDRLKCVASVCQLASTLKKVKEVAALPDVVKFLASLASVAEAARSEISKAKAVAAKTQAMNQKKADAEDGQHEEEEENGDYCVKLLAAFQKLKCAKDLSYEFIVCDAKPCGVMVAKRITSKHKEELTQLTGGSKHFLHPGSCHFENGRFVFNMEQPIAGLARKLQDSIRNFTGKKLPILVGTELADEEEKAGPGEAAHSSAAKAESPALAQAPEAWRKTRLDIETSLNQLKAAVRKELAGEGEAMMAEIEQNMTRVDGILEKLDHRLGESMAKAHAAKDAAARQAELKNSKSILVDYLKYLKSQEPLLAHIDSNPLGVKTNLKQTLTDRLKHMAQAIG